MSRSKQWMMVALSIISLAVTMWNLESLSAAFEEHMVATISGSLLNSEAARGDGSTKRRILLWTELFGDEWFYMGETGHFDGCSKRYKNCELTRSRNFTEVTKFDAILFHGNELRLDDLPAYREPHQRYVYVNLESPATRTFQFDTFFEDFFNTTITYRLDSDIPWPYKVMRNIDTGQVVAPLEHPEWSQPSDDPMRLRLDVTFEGKMKPIAWLVSNCDTPGKRERYVNELRKYVQVDVIGKCSKVSDHSPKCPRSKDCFAEFIEKDYFFYLSFENSLCTDYVTEKFFNAFSYHIIPVVYGGANYSRFAPPRSYIDALDFESPKELAEFLTSLSKDREEYLSYFWWKKFYEVASPNHWTLCNICRLLNEPEGKSKTYSGISSWYAEDQCPIQDRFSNEKFATKASRART
ncbi:alpha-(1,3)-fucosyltransferase C-like isoform X1 [Neodiprion lecontei]|uniref:Fucosyltransferase n=1 Tax=Neodiprion lecontei TaxID=441921 RepID=A0A6J0BHZ2_NEOLC|nr:alpha-(1,3)-fucosyltransferase C-like isoform X1 [Neodiprion lecontei]